MSDDAFVSDILGLDRTSGGASLNNESNISMRTFSPASSGPPRTVSEVRERQPRSPHSPKSSYTMMEEETASPKPSGAAIDDTPTPKRAAGQALFSYALVFINFTFIVASLLMIMAGVVARTNRAVALCDKCGDLTTVSIVFGGILWLFAMFGFNWIRQRNILLLLVYVGFLIALFLVLFSTIIAGIAFDVDIEQKLRNSNFMDEWKATLARNESGLCQLQRSFNCSGFYYGCCRAFNASDPSAPSCYGNETHPEAPPWVAEVCPVCPDDVPSMQPCTSIVFDVLKRNLGGFLVINSFSIFLVITGIALSGLARKVNRHR